MALSVLGKRKGRGARVKRAKGYKGSARIAHGLYDTLSALFSPMFQSVLDSMDYIDSSSAVQALQSLADQQTNWKRILGPSIRGIAGRWANLTSELDKQRLQSSLAKALGVNAVAIFDEPNVQQTVDIMGAEATRLISTISDEYYGKVQEAVMRSYQQLPLPDNQTLTEYIQSLGDISLSHAKLIAVDQTNKMHSMVTQARQTSLGIEEYIWRTAKDSRVVGTPGGLYPEGNAKHGNHYDREGKKYRWDNPPFDGHPGFAIRCRCHAEPIIDYDKLKLN